MNDLATLFFAVIGIIVLIAGLGLLLAFPLMWCWNYTMPELFNLPVITWGQAWCLHFTCAMLIKSTQTNTNK